MATKINLTEKTVDELNALLSEKRELARTTRFNSFASKPKDSNDPKKHRADIARIMTELGKREREAATA
jgi:ribosomal protein L29